MTRQRLVAAVVSGGQTGVDRAALEAARATGTPYRGWCPRGGLAEDHPQPPGVLAAWPGLRETPDDDPADRTTRNVDDSDAVLVLRLDPTACSPGTDLTVTVARRRGRPWLEAWADEVERVATWLVEVAGRQGSPVVLDVAGPRESEDPGVHAATLPSLVSLVGRPG